jgi:hypothetical protein
MTTPGEAVGIDSADPGESDSNPDGKSRSHWLLLFINSSSVAGFANPRFCSIWVCMASAIRKQLNQNGRHRFLVLHFRQNDEDSASCLTR